jgi:hypothetical protein
MSGKRCPYCRNKDRKASERCPACGIVFGAAKKDVTRDERLRAYFARSIHYLGVMFVICGMICLITAPLNILYEYKHDAGPFYVLALGVVNVVVGIGLVRLKRWGYAGGITLVLGEAVLMTVLGAGSSTPFVWFFAILCLYYLMNKTSKSILYRKA